MRTWKLEKKYFLFTAYNFISETYHAANVWRKSSLIVLRITNYVTNARLEGMRTRKILSRTLEGKFTSFRILLCPHILLPFNVACLIDTDRS